MVDELGLGGTDAIAVLEVGRSRRRLAGEVAGFDERKAGRLPAMIAPAWLKNATQPIAIDDTLSYLRDSLAVEESAGREVQIGGPDVLTYGEMLDRMAEVLDVRRRPRIPVPLIAPWLSSLWIGLVTPVDAGVARPLIEGLATPTVVTDPSAMPLFAIEPISFDEALRRAVAQDPELVPA